MYLHLNRYLARTRIRAGALRLLSGCLAGSAAAQTTYGLVWRAGWERCGHTQRESPGCERGHRCDRD